MSLNSPSNPTPGFSDAERAFEVIDKAEREARKKEWIDNNLGSKQKEVRKLKFHGESKVESSKEPEEKANED